MMMFTINLLKAEKEAGRFRKILTTAGAVLPIVIFLAMLGSYIVKKSLVVSYGKEIETIESEMGEHLGNLRAYESITGSLNGMKKTATELAGQVKQYLPFSTVMRSLVDNMPRQVVLNNLESKVASVQSNISGGKGGSGTKGVLSKRSLVVSLFEISGKSDDKAVKDYIGSLKTDKYLSPYVEDIKIVTTKSDEFEGRQITRYDIDCAFNAR